MDLCKGLLGLVWRIWYWAGIVKSGIQNCRTTS